MGGHFANEIWVWGEAGGLLEFSIVHNQSMESHELVGHWGLRFFIVVPCCSQTEYSFT